MSQVAFLGTGLLGSALVEAAVGRAGSTGDTITVWNRTASKAHALQSLGVTVADTPAIAVLGADRVHLVLKDDATVDEVIAALRPGLSASAVVVDHTTTQPALTALRANRLNAEGIRYLHCPVFIGPASARKGQGAIMVSGPQALFEEVQAALEQMAPTVKYFGARADLAAAYKLFGNLFIVGVSALSADVLTLAAGAGLMPERAFDVLEILNPVTTIAGRGRNMAKGDYTPSFELEMARKDVRLMMETAGGRPLAALPGIASRMDDLIAQGHAADDLSVLGKDALT
jgi:3-hydroxyisobutyrate dehydrogenase-like beta-hydroxyacid dehydrogenase